MRGLKLEGGFVKRLRSTPTAIVHGAPSERSTSVRACSFANAVNSCCKLTEAIGIASRQNMSGGMAGGSASSRHLKSNKELESGISLPELFART
jgi:hypothetical protein